MWQHEIDVLFADVDAFVKATETPAVPKPTRPRAIRIQHLALGASLALWAVGCGGETGSGSVAKDAAPKDTGNDSVVADPPPPDGGIDASDSGADAPDDQMVSDPLPDDAGVDVGDDSMWPIHPRPIRVSTAGSARSARARSRRAACSSSTSGWTPRRSAPCAPRICPCSIPPEIRVSATRVGDEIHARLEGAPPGATTRWEAAGEVESDGHTARWTPDPADDALRVAVRSRGGVAVVSVRARSVKEA